MLRRLDGDRERDRAASSKDLSLGNRLFDDRPDGLVARLLGRVDLPAELLDLIGCLGVLYVVADERWDLAFGGCSLEIGERVIALLLRIGRPGPETGRKAQQPECSSTRPLSWTKG